MTLIVYFLILPCAFLVNEENIKSKIVDSHWYLSFINTGNLNNHTKATKEEERHNCTKSAFQPNDNNHPNVSKENQIDDKNGVLNKEGTPSKNKRKFIELENRKIMCGKSNDCIMIDSEGSNKGTIKN